MSAPARPQASAGAGLSALSFLNAGGHALSDERRQDFEARVGSDLSGVRIHDGPAAAQAARALKSRAFTVGQDIVFGRDQYAPDSGAGARLLAHELAHVALGHAGIHRESDPDPDHPSSPAAAPAGVNLQPLADWTPQIDTWDQGTFWTPPETTRAQISQRLYNTAEHVGGFDIIGDKHVRMRNFDGVAADVVKAMRAALDARLDTDVGAVVGILKQRLINDDAEWRLLNTTIWWSSHGDLTNDKNRSYFDAYLDTLDTHRLTQWGLFSNTTKTASEWLLIEAEEKQWALYPVLAGRSSRGTVKSAATGEGMPEFDPSKGPITADKREHHFSFGNEVGGYAYRSGENRTGIEKEAHTTASIQVGELIVNETSATRAEIALRNSAQRGGRVMIPGGDRRFYGYTIVEPHFWDEGYVQPQDPKAKRLETFWWNYPGTVFIGGGEYQPSFGKGGEPEQTQRREILAQALPKGVEALRGLDFDVLSLMTLDQRVGTIDVAVAAQTPADASLISRILFSTPAADFAALERRLSTSETMARLLNWGGATGTLAMIGRIFTLKAVEAMQVPGESLTALPEFKAGFDKDGHYHYAIPEPTKVESQALAPGAFGTAGEVSMGHEKAGPGVPAGAFTRTASRLKPMVLRLGGFAGNLVRGMMQTLMVPSGPPLGPFLPTQLVRVTLLGETEITRTVTLLEAVGLLEFPTEEALRRLLETHVRGGLWVLAGGSLLRAFGPAVAESLAAGGGARAVAGSVAEVAATQAGRAALVNAALLGGMQLVDSYRSELQKSAEGRAFLEIYDVAMLVWISHDVGRLITSGLVPRLVAAADRAIAAQAAVREAMMPLRAEAEALRRTIARYTSPAEAAVAAAADGAEIATAGPKPMSFGALFSMARGEVAAERVLGQVAGTAAQPVAKRVLNRLEAIVSATSAEATTASATSAQGPEAALAAKKAAAAAERASASRFAVAQRAAQLRPEAREAFLGAVDAVISTRPNALPALLDLLTAASESARPNVFIAEVQKLASRSAVSAESLAVLGQKARAGTLDIAWLNRTAIKDEVLDFLGRDPRTPWNLYQQAATDPAAEGVMRNFRTAARGAGAELAAAPVAEELGTQVRRQVKMGSSEIDFEVVVAGRRRGFEVKGWTPATWDKALDAAIKRLAKKGLTEAEQQAVEKIDHMLGQLADAKAATAQAPMLGLTDALSSDSRARLTRILESKQLGATTIVPLSEARITNASQVSIGAGLGVPLP